MSEGFDYITPADWKWLRDRVDSLTGGWTEGDIKIFSGYDLILYSDAGSTETARVDGATGNITTSGYVQTDTVQSSGTVLTINDVLKIAGDDVQDSGGNITISFDGAGNIDILATIKQNATTFQGADDVEGNIHIQKATIDSTHIRWSLSHRSDNKDFWIYGYDGSTYKTFLKFDWDTQLTEVVAALKVTDSIESATTVSLKRDTTGSYTHIASSPTWDDGTGIRVTDGTGGFQVYYDGVEIFQIVSGGDVYLDTDIYTKHATGLFRFRTETADQVTKIRVFPSGTEDQTYLQLANASDTSNFGYMSFLIDGTTAKIAAGLYGTGTAPTTLDITNSYWDNIDIGDSNAIVDIGAHVTIQSTDPRIGVSTANAYTAFRATDTTTSDYWQLRFTSQATSSIMSVSFRDDSAAATRWMTYWYANTGMMQQLDGNEVSLSGWSGYFAIGAGGGAHLAFDPNEIQAKSNNTTATTLYLNPHGGLIDADGATAIVGNLYGAATGASDTWIWAVSGDNSNYGIFYNEGAPDFMEWQWGGAVKFKINMQTGNIIVGSTDGINASFEAFNGIGATNTQYYPCVPTYHDQANYEIFDGRVQPLSSGTTAHLWATVPAKRGSLDFYIDGWELGVYAADADDYIDEVKVMKASATSVSTVHTDPGNYTTTGRKTQTFTASSMSGYQKICIAVKFYITGSKQVQITYCNVRGYYA